MLQIDRANIISGSEILDSQYSEEDHALHLDQVEMLYGLKASGFRLCYYRKVTVYTHPQSVSSTTPPSQTSCTEFIVGEQLITVTCGADDFSDVTTHGFLSLFILFLQEIKFFTLWGLFDAPEKEVHYSTIQKIQTIIASVSVGCTYNSDINHYLVPYAFEADLLGMKRFLDQSQINRFLRHNGWSSVK